MKKLKFILSVLTLSFASASFAGQFCECIKQDLPKRTDSAQYASIWDLPKKLGASLGDYMDQCFGTYDPNYSRASQLCSSVDLEKALTYLPNPIQNAKECLKGNPAKLKQLNEIVVTSQSVRSGEILGGTVLSFFAGDILVHSIPNAITSKALIELNGQGILTVGNALTGLKYGYEAKHLAHEVADYSTAVNKMALQSVYDTSCLKRNLR